MIKAPKKSIFIWLALFAIFTFAGKANSIAIPVSGMVEEAIWINNNTNQSDSFFQTEYLETENENKEYKSLNDFILSVANGQADVITGIFMEEGFAFPVIQQPEGQPAFVSSADEVVTEFAMPRTHGVVGLLAHNYLAGKFFFEIQMNDIIQIIYGDGQVENYQVVAIQQYQALQPNSPSSEFLDLETSQKLTASQLFNKVYTGEHHITLQTCIQDGMVDTWGRLFIIAEPIV